MALHRSDHGGQCCGMQHLSNFDNVAEEGDEVPFADKVAAIKEGVERCREHFEDEGCIEVVLAQYQFPVWQRALQKCGFRMVRKFLNGNTGNECRVYLLTVGQQGRYVVK